MIRTVLNKTPYRVISPDSLWLGEPGILAQDEIRPVQTGSTHRKWDNAGLHNRLKLGLSDGPTKLVL